LEFGEAEKIDYERDTGRAIKITQEVC